MVSLAGKKVLVVGGSGYLGGYIARTLVARKAQVTSLSRYACKKYSDKVRVMNIPKMMTSTGLWVM
jgi:NAD(P)-dependent dehydrogenase (short-subunit alcohol dehydrogenase family)